MSEDCEWCGARPRHQRLAERSCAQCGDPFQIVTEASRKRFCGRPCQLRAYRGER